MKKTLLIGLLCLFFGDFYSQQKFLTLENNLLNFKVSLANLSQTDAQSVIDILKSDIQNRNFEMEDTNILVFNRILNDQTRLNTVKRSLNSTVTSYNVSVNFDKLDQVPQILLPGYTQYFRFLISDVNNQTDAANLINFMLNENRFHLLDIDLDTHYMTIVTDVDFEYELIKDILKSQGKTIFDATEIEKYY
jgi:hypothetical protein